MRVAVVDFGTNSTRLLVADVRDGAVATLEHRTTVTRLGQGVDASGRLAPEAIDRVLEAAADYRATIDARHADRVIGVATSAVRDAANGSALTDALAKSYGIPTRTISGDEEARLTFLGATAVRPHAAADTVVIDIGGGSTEYVVGRPGDPEPGFHVSTRMGSVRHTERHLHDDPPTAGQLAALRAEATQIIAAEVPQDLRDRTDAAIAVAGTATSLAAIDQALDPYDPDRVDGYRLTLDSAERDLANLAALPVERRRDVTGLHPDRAPTIVAGAAILVESMKAFGLPEVEVSEADILHGAALFEARKAGR